jgi:hypothetical protein
MTYSRYAHSFFIFPSILSFSLTRPSQKNIEPNNYHDVKITYIMKTDSVLVIILICVTFVFTSGCTGQTAPAGSIPTSDISTRVTVTTTVLPITAPPTTIQTPAPTPLPEKHDKITDGFWCRDKTMNIGKASKNVRECYKFSPDGTFTWGYSPGRLMGKSPSCWAPDVNCTYSLTANGQYEISGGYFFTLSGDILVDPHDQPYFSRSSTGIP